MTDQSEVQSAMAEARQEWEQYWQTVALVRRVLNVSAAKLADEMGLTRQTMTGRLNGQTRIEPWEMAGFAKALDVPVDVLEMSPEDALRWLADNRKELVRISYFQGSLWVA